MTTERQSLENYTEGLKDREHFFEAIYLSPATTPALGVQSLHLE